MGWVRAVLVEDAEWGRGRDEEWRGRGKGMGPGKGNVDVVVVGGTLPEGVGSVATGVDRPVETEAKEEEELGLAKCVRGMRRVPNSSTVAGMSRLLSAPPDSEKRGLYVVVVVATRLGLMREALLPELT